MYYLCPKCGNFMQAVSTASIPAVTTYICFNCGYKSKPDKPATMYATLPRELWSEEDSSNECSD